MRHFKCFSFLYPYDSSPLDKIIEDHAGQITLPHNGLTIMISQLRFVYCLVDQKEDWKKVNT